MKIGVLTYYSVCNFGANLQALSTVGKLISMGHQPIFINWYPNNVETYYRQITPQSQYDCTQEYVNKYLVQTTRCYTSDDVAKAIKHNEVEAVVVGSDAVLQHHPWHTRIVFPTRHIYTIRKVGADKLCPNPFWGDFYSKLDGKVPAAMMSASSQNSPYKTYSAKERKLMDELLSRFSYISTRDDWTSNMVKYITKGKITPSITPDPVFAFNQNVSVVPSEEEIRKKFNLLNPYYLVGFHNSNVVDQLWLKHFASIAKAKGTDTVAFPFPPGIEFKHPFDKQIDVPLSPLDWYALIKYSAGYVGHNMHPIVICLANATPCFSFDHYGIEKFRVFVNEKSSKIYHIMSHFGILANRVSCVGKLQKMPTPDYVMMRLEAFDKEMVASKAIEYLSNYNKMMDDILSSFK